MVTQVHPMTVTYNSTKKECTMIYGGRPPQVDLVPARYIFFANVPVKMRENSET